jgi:hypothetical protein
MLKSEVQSFLKEIENKETNKEELLVRIIRRILLDELLKHELATISNDELIKLTNTLFVKNDTLKEPIANNKEGKNIKQKSNKRKFIVTNENIDEVIGKINNFLTEHHFKYELIDIDREKTGEPQDENIYKFYKSDLTLINIRKEKEGYIPIIFFETNPYEYSIKILAIGTISIEFKNDSINIIDKKYPMFLNKFTIID